MLQAVFLIDWYNATGEDIFAADHFPLLGPDVPPMLATEGETIYAPVQILTSGPDSEWRAIRQLYFAMIVSAQHRVRLQSPFFILDPTITEALTSAALAGVDVEVMVSAEFSGPQGPLATTRRHSVRWNAISGRRTTFGSL